MKLRRQRNFSISRLLYVTLVALLATFSLMLVAPAEVSAVPVCPPPGGNMTNESPPRCLRTADNIPLYPTCPSPYVLIQNTFDCQAAPIEQTPPPTTTPPQPVSCANPADHYDPALKMCVHNPTSINPATGVIECYAPYVPINNTLCGTSPGNSTVKPSSPKDPRCAYVNYGPIRCPINEGIPINSQGCYVSDPTSPNLAARSWKSTTCTDPAFTPPETINCDPSTPAAAKKAYCDASATCGNGGTCNLTTQYVNPFIKVLAAMVGIGVALSIIAAGIQYATSADDSRKVAAARRRIAMSLLTLIGFFLFFAFLNWIIPGGIR